MFSSLSIDYFSSFQLLETTSSSIPWEFSNCSDVFKAGKDEHYVTCFKFLSNDSDFCDYLNYVNLAFTFPYYFLGLIPLILSLFALVINLIFIYITLLIIRDVRNGARKTYVFLLNRSISSIIAQIMFYIVLIAWKNDGFGYLSTVIFLTVGSLTFLTLAGTYFILSIKIYLNISWRNNNLLTLTKCVILNGIVWVYNVIFSVFIGIYGATLVYPEESKINCQFENCQRPLAISITVLLGVYYFAVLIVYFGLFIKITLLTLASGGATQINTQNLLYLRRILYNIIVFALTKIPLIVICGFTLHDLENLRQLGNGEETSCKKFLHGKLYFKVELLASITIFVILLAFKMVLSNEKFTSETSEFFICQDQNYSFFDNDNENCLTYLPNDTDPCENLEYYLLANSIIFYSMGVIPFTFSIFSFVVNFLFIYVTVLILCDKKQCCRKTYIFLFNRSISVLLGHAIYFGVVFVANFLELKVEIPSITALYLILDTLSFFNVVRIYFVLSITFLTAVINPIWYLNNITFKKCIALNVVIWTCNILISALYGICIATSVYPDEYSLFNCITTKCPKPMTILITAILTISYFTVILVYTVAFINQSRNKKK